MPIYEYRCQDCDNLFEALLTASQDKEDVACTRCGSRKVKKTISASSYRLSSTGGKIPAGALSGCGAKSGFS